MKRLGHHSTLQRPCYDADMYIAIQETVGAGVPVVHA